MHGKNDTLVLSILITIIIVITIILVIIIIVEPSSIYLDQINDDNDD